VAKSQQMFEVTSVCLYTCTQPCLPLVNGFINDALRSKVPSVNVPLLQLVIVTRFGFCVMSGSVET